MVLVDIEAPDFGTLCRMIGDQLVAKESVTPEVSEKLIGNSNFSLRFQQ